MSIDPERLLAPELTLERLEYDAMCVEVSDMVEQHCITTGESYDLMCIVPRGGMTIGEIFGRRLGFTAIEIASQSITSYTGKKKSNHRFGQTITPHLVEGKRLLVPDDTSDTDETLQAFRNIAYDMGAETVDSAVVVYKDENNKTGIAPTFFLFKYNGWINFPLEGHDTVGERSVVCRANRLRLEAEAARQTSLQ